ADWDDHYDHDWQDHQPYQEETPNLEQFVSHHPHLSEYLCEQIAQMPVDPELKTHAEALAYLLDDNGYLYDNLKDIAEQQHTSETTLEKALTLVQNCLPSGVGARNLEECLNLQIAALPHDTPYRDLLERIMTRYFPFIAKNPKMIRQRLGISEDEYRHAIALLKSLDPLPGQNFGHSAPQYIQPEIIVREKNGISYVETGDTLRPDIELNATYAKLAETCNDKDRTLLSAQLQEARWFLSAIDKRADTVKRVAGVIVAIQQEFFQEGATAMRPLTRQKVAEMLDIHESTVSRAVNGKYLTCKRGIYELRYFFSNQLENSDGDEQSAIAIRAIIEKIIQNEDPYNPLSDQAISDLLAKEGQQVARRTISKYRELMNIPSTTQRRKR
ncbi:MAG: RNA polymerase factor sigma-54, partial [Cardiobacteriaceae bacterium]|nr:RNA polymerase factor sigma-54 [Cardiobacteriaceae bacterium]